MLLETLFQRKGIRQQNKRWKYALWYVNQTCVIRTYMYVCTCEFFSNPYFVTHDAYTRSHCQVNSWIKDEIFRHINTYIHIDLCLHAFMEDVYESLCDSL